MSAPPIVRRLLFGVTTALAGLASMVGAALWEPRADAPRLDVPLAVESFVAGDLEVRLHDAALLDADDRSIRARATGLEPRVEVAWLGSGSHGREVRLTLENVNLAVGRVSLAPGTREVSRRGATLEVEAALRDGPLTAALSIPTPGALAEPPCVAVFACSRSNRLIQPILEDISRERPLFVVHVGDLGHGLAYESEALRRALDDMGIPLFVAPGNHDQSAIPRASLHDFHRYLNPAPLTFDALGQRFILLDVSDYPIRDAQLDRLEREVATAGARRVWVFLHRAPVDLAGFGRELPREAGAGRLEEILAKAPDARVFAGHLHGLREGTFAGHPFVMTSGGGENICLGEEVYHHLLVPLDGGSPTVIRYAPPTWAGGLLSRASFEAPTLLGRPEAGLLGSGAVLVLAWLVRRRARAGAPT